MAAGAEARDVYVDAVIGDDGFNGASLASPFRTLTRMTVESLLPGDHVWIGPGTYDTALGEVFPITVPAGVWLHGSAAGGVVVRNYAPLLAIPTLFFDVGGGVEHLRVEGLGLARIGIVAEEDFTVRFCEVTGFTIGIFLGNGHAESAPPRWGVERRAEGNLVFGNDTGISDGILSCVADGNQADVIVNNLIVGNGTGVNLSSFGFGGATVNNFALVWNNTIADNRGDGIVTSSYDPNTGLGGISAPRVINNVIAGNGGYGISRSTNGREFSTNLFSGNLKGDADPRYPLAPDNLFAAPRFANPAALDYHVLPGSPGIDQGREDGPAVQDFDFDPRPLDGDGNSTTVTDIGYDELRPDSGGPRLRRALTGRLMPMAPDKPALFPFLAANARTPIIRDPFSSGQTDPRSGILGDVLLPLVLYQVVEPEPVTSLLAVKESGAQTVVFYLAP